MEFFLAIRVIFRADSSIFTSDGTLPRPVVSGLQTPFCDPRIRVRRPPSRIPRWRPPMIESPDLPLAATFFEHLTVEENLSREAHRCLDDLHAAIRSGDREWIASCQARQTQVADSLRQATAARVRAAEALGDALRIPRKEICLSTFAARLPGNWGLKAREAQHRLTAATAQLSDAVRRNATLVSSLRQFFNGVVADLTGSVPSSRYGPSGVLVGAATGPAFPSRG